jgi:hypothetical protein
VEYYERRVGMEWVVDSYQIKRRGNGNNSLHGNELNIRDLSSILHILCECVSVLSHFVQDTNAAQMS